MAIQGDAVARRCCAPLFVLLAIASPTVTALQVDIQGPPGSGLFGWHAAVLPNGNFVVTDPYFSTPGARHAGAIYLYHPDGTLVSTLTGSSDNDNVGDAQILVLHNGNFVVSSQQWNNGSALAAGAVTWIDGTTGLSGVVSAQNSLVGSSTGDFIGDYNGLVELTNGNYVVASPLWSNGTVAHVGAVTWANGATGIHGVVSADNSLVGSEPGDLLSAEQSFLPGVVALATGNYVVPSACWSHDTETEIGAVTWVDGARGISGEVSVRNSFVGSLPYERLGLFGVTALGNGNYVVLNPSWSNGKGAATWADGRIGRVGRASRGNSLVGARLEDRVGAYATALADGNYVVGSPHWGGDVGAVTWADGAKGSKGTVSLANSLVGVLSGDFVGFGSVAALPSGDYAIASPFWNNGALAQVGALTWVHGGGTTAGTVGANNSIIGSQPNDRVGSGGVIAVGSGNYLVLSPDWSSGAAAKAGAATWVNGSGPQAGVVSEENSLVGGTPNDAVGSYGSVRLTNGNYVVASGGWHDASGNSVGAFTWMSGDRGRSGIVSAENSLVGTPTHSGAIVTALSDGNYVISNQFSLFGEIESSGSVTLGDGSLGLVGPIAPWNSVISDAATYLTWRSAYDAARKRLVVGRPDANRVTLFTASEQIFASGFEP